MTAVKRSVISLYSGAEDIYSHQVRIVLAEKGVCFDVLNVDPNKPCEDLIELNPYNTLPTLVDRDLVLYTSKIIMEYLDERFPHPPLLPVYPVSRARCRLTMDRIQRDWYALAEATQSADKEEAVRASNELRDGLIALIPVFAETPYFLSEDFTLVDCYMAPLLWRLPLYGITLPKSANDIEVYANRLFERESFQVSLTELEREIREPYDF